MKLILLSLAVLGCAIAEDAPYKPQGALLVLPQQFNPAAAQVQQEEAESIDKISERVMERLRQEQGSQTGNYHVYLADGRLQKVQYTAAPLRNPPTQNTQQVSLQNSQSSTGSNTYQFNQQNAQANSRYQPYTQQNAQADSGYQQNAQAGSRYQPYTQQNAQADSGYQQNAQTDSRYQSYTQQNAQADSGYQQNAQTDSRYQPYNQQNAQGESRYQQQQYSPSQTSNSYSRVSVQGSQPAGSGESQASEPNPVVAHFGRLQQEKLQQQLKQLQQQQEQLKQQAEEVQQQLQQQQEFASNFVATVQYSEVPPIPAPIYSQSPAPITRILRYAPQYY